MGLAEKLLLRCWDIKSGKAVVTMKQRPGNELALFSNLIQTQMNPAQTGQVRVALAARQPLQVLRRQQQDSSRCWHKEARGGAGCRNTEFHATVQRKKIMRTHAEYQRIPTNDCSHEHVVEYYFVSKLIWLINIDLLWIFWFPVLTTSTFGF